MLPIASSEQVTAQCIYSPISNTPAIFWRAVVQEQYLTFSTKTSSDIHDNSVRTETTVEWRTIIDHQNCADFYLQVRICSCSQLAAHTQKACTCLWQDGGAKLLVQGSNGYHCQVQMGGYDGTIGEHNSNLDQAFTKTPPFNSSSVPNQVQWMVSAVTSS